MNLNFFNNSTKNLTITGGENLTKFSFNFGIGLKTNLEEIKIPDRLI